MISRRIGISYLVVALLWGSYCSPVGAIHTVPSVGLPGYWTYNLTLNSPPGTKIVGFDFVGNGSSFGITGDFHQVNPAGLATVFTDVNNAFPLFNLDPSQDTHFTFPSTKGIVINAQESASFIRAAFNYFPVNIATDASNQWEFLQIASNKFSYSMLGTITVRDAAGIDTLQGIAIGSPLSAPPALTNELIENASAEGGEITRQIKTNGLGGFAPTMTFQFLSFTPAPGETGTGPVLPASLDAQRNFHWNPAGSPLGTYVWKLVGQNGVGTGESTVTVRLTAVPEPGTVILLGTALLATTAVQCRRRRKCGRAAAKLAEIAVTKLP